MSVIYGEREILEGGLVEITATARDGIFVWSRSPDAADRAPDTHNWKQTLDRLNVASADRGIGPEGADWGHSVAGGNYDAQQQRKQHGASTWHGPNETEMSDGGRWRALLGVKVSKSSQKWSVQRSDVRSIAWLDGWCGERHV
jgi:hypothetical protein